MPMIVATSDIGPREIALTCRIAPDRAIVSFRVYSTRVELLLAIFLSCLIVAGRSEIARKATDAMMTVMPYIFQKETYSRAYLERLLDTAINRLARNKSMKGFCNEPPVP